MPHAWQPLQRTLPVADGDEGSTALPWRGDSFACCAVSDAYRFVYVKPAKTAGSSVLLGYLRP